MSSEPQESKGQSRVISEMALTYFMVRILSHALFVEVHLMCFRLHLCRFYGR